jgi:DNA invertase Pin-like site-specific DNA recombinase
MAYLFGSARGNSEETILLSRNSINTPRPQSLTVLSAVAELERSLIVERVPAGPRNALASGLSSTEFGSDCSG